MHAAARSRLRSSESLTAFLSLAAALAIPGAASAQLTDLGARLLEECAAAGACETNDRLGSALAVGDFDNDGFDDLAVGVDGQDVDGVNAAGAVHVFYGAPGGLRPQDDVIFDVTDLGGSPEGGANFGFALAAADFTGDGIDDLAIGEPDRNIDGASDAGAVWVMRGSASGLTSANRFYFDQDTISTSETPESGDRFGAALGAGRVDSGTRADLVIGVPGEDFIPGVEIDAGKIHVLYNSGTTPLAREQDWTQSDLTFEPECNSEWGGIESGDRFGSSISVRNFDDLSIVVVGSPFEDGPGSVDQGRIDFLYGQDDGLLFHSTCNFNFPGVEAQYGAATAFVNFLADDFETLVAGAPVYDGGLGTPDGGVVSFFPSSGVHAQETLNQDDFEANPETGDQFGAALTKGDFDGDGFEDLAIGAPGEDVESLSADDAGMIHVLYGTHGLVQSMHSNLPAGMPDSPNPSDFFGAALAAGDFDGSGTDDLAVGVPGEDLGAADAAGMVTVIYGLDHETGAFGTVEYADNFEVIVEPAASQIVTVLVERRGGAPVAASAEYLRVGGTATPGQDFQFTPGTVSWPAGSLANGSFVLSLLGDTLDESNETITFGLEDPSAGVALGAQDTFQIIIADNDSGGTVQFGQPSVTVIETGASVAIQVVRAAGAASGVTVDYDTADGTATAGTDYVASSGTVTFAAGDNSENVVIPLLDDVDDDGTETFTVTLSNPGGGATLGTIVVCQVTVLDNEIFLDGFESGNTLEWTLDVP